MIMASCRATTIRWLITSSKPRHHHGLGLASMSATARVMSSWSRPVFIPTFRAVANHRTTNLAIPSLSGLLKVRRCPHWSSHSTRCLFSTSGNVELNDVLVMDSNFKPVDPQEFDLLLPDIEAEMIRKMEIDGVKHLSPADEIIISPSNPTATMNGITFADDLRVFVRAVLSAKGKSTNVFMLVDTSSPYTFLTEETIKAVGVTLHGRPDDQEGYLLISGYGLIVRASKGGFKDVNVLGTDFLGCGHLYVNYLNGTARITVDPYYYLDSCNKGFVE